MEVVSEKTGYPAEMLELSMELEADLGVDSIKRVEILSAMQDRVPELPEVDTAEMAQLHTLGEIVNSMSSHAPAPAPTPAPPQPAGISSDPCMAHPNIAVSPNAFFGRRYITKVEVLSAELLFYMKRAL